MTAEEMLDELEGTIAFAKRLAEREPYAVLASRLRRIEAQATELEALIESAHAALDRLALRAS